MTMENIISPNTNGFFLERYFMSSIFAALLITVGIGTSLAFFQLDSFFGILLVIIGILIFILSLTHSKLHCNATKIYFDEDKLVYETGIINHKKKKIPVNMITDTSITRTLIEKIFNIATLNISTSGSSGYEITCKALNHYEAEEFHTALYDMIKKYKPNQRASDQAK